MTVSTFEVSFKVLTNNDNKAYQCACCPFMVSIDDLFKLLEILLDKLKDDVTEEYQLQQTNFV